MISVAMAVYNGEKYLEEQLESIFAQSMPVDEVIIVNDASKDQSRAVIERFQKRFPQISYVENETNSGFKQAFYRALSLCSGDLIFLCDQDDRWKPDKVKKMLEVFNKTKGVCALASSFDFMNAKSEIYQVELLEGWSNQNLLPKPVKKGAVISMKLQEFYLHNYFQGCALLIDRSLKDQYLASYTEKLPHDWLLNMMAAQRNGMYFYNEPLFDYRIHAQNTIGVPTHTFSDRFRILFDEDRRTIVCEQSLDALSTAKELFGLNEEDQSLLNFVRTNLKAIQNRDLKLLKTIAQSPWYEQVKGSNGYLADRLFILNALLFKHRKKES